MASCAAVIGLAMVLLILPPPVQPAPCAVAGALNPIPRIAVAANAIPRPLRIDTHLLRVEMKNSDALVHKDRRGLQPAAAGPFRFNCHNFAMRAIVGFLVTVWKALVASALLFARR